MAFTYSAAEASDLHKVRGKVGDTSSGDALLDDDTITEILTEFTSVPTAAVEACKRILAQFARRVDRSGIGLSSNRSDAFEQYERLLKVLEREASASGAEMFVGGATLSEAVTLESDTDFRPRSFKIGMDDYT